MYSLNRVKTTCILKRICNNFCTSSVNNSISKQGKVINKLMRKNNREDMINFAFSEPAERGLSIHTRRRMAALNKIFMSHITDLMSTGEIEPELMHKSIEITQVKITADFKLINVYWTDTSKDQSDTVEILKKCAFQLRHELSQLRVIGSVPPIQFVKCKHVEILQEIERKLQIADYGEDHIINPYPFAINHTVTSKNINSNETKEANENSDDTFKVTLPVMKHDVFGLDHFRIMSKIKASREQSKVASLKRAQDTQLNLTATTSESVANSDIGFLSKANQDEEFSKFLIDRQKKLRLKHKTEHSAERVIALNNMDNDDDDDDDFDYDFEKDTEDISDEESEFGNSLIQK